MMNDGTQSKNQERERVYREIDRRYMKNGKGIVRYVSRAALVTCLQEGSHDSVA